MKVSILRPAVLGSLSLLLAVGCAKDRPSEPKPAPSATPTPSSSQAKATADDAAAKRAAVLQAAQLNFKKVTIETMRELPRRREAASPSARPGYTFVEADRHADAERVFLETLEKAPDDVSAHWGLCFTYIRARQFGRATEAIEAAAKKFPADPDFRTLRSILERAAY